MINVTKPIKKDCSACNIKVCKYWATMKSSITGHRAYSDDIRMPQAKQQSNLRSKLLLKQISQALVFLGLAYELNRHIPLLVYPSINPTVPARSEFTPYEQLRHIRAPISLPLFFYLSTR